MNERAMSLKRLYKISDDEAIEMDEDIREIEEANEFKEHGADKIKQWLMELQQMTPVIKDIHRRYLKIYNAIEKASCGKQDLLDDASSSVEEMLCFDDSDWDYGINALKAALKKCKNHE